MLLAGTTLTGPSPLQSALCVWLGVSFHLLLPVLVRKVSSCRLIMSGLIGLAKHSQLELLPQMNAWTVDSDCDMLRHVD